MKLKLLLLLVSLSPVLSFSETENYQRPHYIDFVPLDASGYLNPAALGQPVEQKGAMVLDRPMTTTLKVTKPAAAEPNEDIYKPHAIHFVPINKFLKYQTWDNSHHQWFKEPEDPTSYSK